jgi:hypothetical protein
LADISSLNRPQLSPDDEYNLRYWLSQPGTIFAGHTKGNESFPAVSTNLETVALHNGYQKQILSVVCDRNGRAIFQVFSFSNSGNAGNTPQRK